MKHRSLQALFCNADVAQVPDMLQHQIRRFFTFSPNYSHSDNHWRPTNLITWFSSFFQLPTTLHLLSIFSWKVCNITVFSVTFFNSAHPGTDNLLTVFPATIALYSWYFYCNIRLFIGWFLEIAKAMYDVWFVIKDFFDFASKYTTAVPSQQQQQQKQQQQTAHDTVFPLGRGSNLLLFVFYSKIVDVHFYTWFTFFTPL